VVWNNRFHARCSRGLYGVCRVWCVVTDSLATFAETQDVAQVALEGGNSPQNIFQHHRELVRLKEAKAWFAIELETARNVTAHHTALAA
jgi:hypothetical protein